MKLFLLILKNLRRNKVRSILTALAIFLLVGILSLIATVTKFMDDLMTEQSKDVLGIITERYRIPSQFDRKYMDDIRSPGNTLNAQLSSVDGFRNEQTNLWHFVAFNLDPAQKDPNQFFVVIATWPEQINKMTDGLKDFDLDGKLVGMMKKPPVSRAENIGILVGRERLEKIGKRVGDVFKAPSISHRGADGKSIEFEFEIVGELPGGNRWAQIGFMDFEYLNRVLKAVGSNLDGKVNLGWIMSDSQDAARQIGGIIESYVPDIKCETFSAAVGRFLEPFKDILYGVKFLLIPVIFVVMTVIVANAISITVRERRLEIAVLKVLGFRPGQIMTLVLGEGVLLGTIAGGLSSVTVWAVLNNATVPGFGGLKVPNEALYLGAMVGAGTAFLGSLIPAISARWVKVAEVFSKVA
jgi:putative ABC transport system permease protein